MKKQLTESDIHEVQTLLQNPWFSVRKARIALSEGEPRDFYAVHHARPAVGIVAMQEEKILLIRQYRYLIDRVVWAIPSGGVDADEPPAPHGASCGKRAAITPAASANLSAITPPMAAATSCLLPLSPPIWNSSAWTKIRMR